MHLRYLLPRYLSIVHSNPSLDMTCQKFQDASYRLNIDNINRRRNVGVPMDNKTLEPRCRLDIPYVPPVPLERTVGRVRGKTPAGRILTFTRGRARGAAQGRAPIQKGGYAATWRRERKRKRENVILVTPVTLSIPLWHRIRNSGDDPTTVFGDLPRASSSRQRFYRASLFPSFPLFLPHSFHPRFSLSFRAPFRLFFFSSFSFFSLDKALSLGALSWRATPPDALLPPPPSSFRVLLPRRSSFFADLHLLDLARARPYFFSHRKAARFTRELNAGESLTGSQPMDFSRQVLSCVSFGSLTFR